PDKGVSEGSRQGANAVSASVSVKETVALDANAKPDAKSTNSLYFRSPVTAHIQIKTGNTLLAEAKVPVYQAGQVQLLPVMP
ncbi:MAG: DUF4831 family protein, partial [Bacteroidales bacterium]|nr:DUF4831 family protein [Bacteroidales bacterium]